MILSVNGCLNDERYLSGLQAFPIAVPRGLQKTSSTYQLPDGFRMGEHDTDIRRPIPDSYRQGTELSRRFLVDLNTGLVQDNIGEFNYQNPAANAVIWEPI